MRPLVAVLKHGLSFGGTGAGFDQGPFWSRPSLRLTSTATNHETVDDCFADYITYALKANGVVFACVLARQMTFSEVRFQYQRLNSGKPGDLFGNPTLSLLENPWPNGTTGELLSRMEQDASLAGNFYGTTAGKGADLRIRRLRPDWVTIVTGSPSDDPLDIEAKVIGYLYQPTGGGKTRNPVLLTPDKVVHYCVDEQTEILTSEGWKTHATLQAGDEALTLNHETGMSEWQPVSEVCTFPAQQRDMLAMEGAEHSSLTTLNHRWPVERKNSRAGRYERRWATSDSFSTGDRVPTAAYCADLPQEQKWTDALVETVAWFWTEGSILKQRDGRRGRGVRISQSLAVNSPKVARIRAALTVLFGAPVEKMQRTGPRTELAPCWRESVDGRNAIFHLSANAADVVTTHAPGRVVGTEFLRSLTASQLALFIDVSILADGWREATGRMRLAQKDPAAAEAFAFACILAGYSVSIREGVLNAYGYRMTVVSLGKTRHFGVGDHRARFRREQVTHDGMVWCPRTPNQTWLARRAGSVYFTGNSPIPDPDAQWRGMSWITPVVGEIQGHSAASRHKLKFFQHGTTSGTMVSYDKSVTRAQFLEYVEAYRIAHEGVDNAYKTIHMGGGADVKALGANLQQLDFKATQGAAETLIAAASGAGAIIAQLSEGMQGSSLNAGNFGAARRRFADMVIRPLWRTASASLSKFAEPPPGTRLWYDGSDVAFLQEDAKDAAEIESTKATTIKALVEAGFEPASVVAAVQSQDMNLLTHTGMTSVQLMAPGTQPAPAA